MKINISGLLYHIISYGVDPKTEQFDFAAIRRLAKEHRPNWCSPGLGLSAHHRL